jgi:hypothetical protein
MPNMTPQQAVTMFLDLTLPRAQARLSEKVVDMQMHLSGVAQEIGRHGTSTKTGALPNMLAEILALHEKVSVLLEVQKLNQAGA